MLLQLKIKRGRGRVEIAAVTKVVQLKGANLLEGRCLKAYLFAIAANWDEIRKVEGLLQITSFSLTFAKKSTKVVVTLLQTNYKAIYALNLNF